MNGGTIDALRERILDTAVTQAQHRSWEALRLHDVARELGISLDDIRRCFQEKETLVDAWFDRADAAMLARATDPAFLALPPRDRLKQLLLSWLAPLAANKRVTREMILNKLEPGHLHYQFGGLLRISRTVQWWREAARRDATLPRRAIEEAILTGVYLAAFVKWLSDVADNTAATEAFLDRLLAGAEGIERAFSEISSGPAAL
jgi:AcrR family transcriptional regulator